MPTTGSDKGVDRITNPDIRNTVLKLQGNAGRYGFVHFSIDDLRQEILPIVPWELGISQPAQQRYPGVTNGSV